jgi:hypothetical protein
MNTLLVLLVAELFAFGAMWHNKSARSGMERESERPDPAVLFSCIRPKRLQMAPRCPDVSPKATNLAGVLHPHEC